MPKEFMKGQYIDYKGATGKDELDYIEQHLRRWSADCGRDLATLTDEELINIKRRGGGLSSAAMAKPKLVKIYLAAIRERLKPKSGDWLVMIRVRPECAEGSSLTEEKVKNWVMEQFLGCDLGDVEVLKVEKE